MPGTTRDRFWSDLLEGRDLVTQVDPSRWSLDEFTHPARNHPGTSVTFAAGSIGDVSGFDAAFFGISPREAALMDPQQRVLLELAWEAMESAGVPPERLRGTPCGVYVGIATADYSMRFADDLGAIDASFATGNTASIAANRLSYIYDLRGPSMAIDTACSSSLVAFHQACLSITSGESPMALAGGISLHLHPLGFISFSKASMLSSRGRCRVFDASGDGYVRSEGGGLFLLKDFDQAVADGDPIEAVVLHSAVNTDGRKSGLTVPSARAQTELLVASYRAAGITPDLVQYVEAHGTGTAVGDPIEARSLSEALGRRRDRSTPLLIGSVKSNLGHLETGSGVAGLLKAIGCIRERVVPATIGIETLNPHIPFEDWNIEVVTSNRVLPAFGPITVGVNSFGFGGANAHVVLQSYEEEEVSRPRVPRNVHLPLLVSGRDPAALRANAAALAQMLHGQPQRALYDIAHESVHGREWHEHRAIVFGVTPASLAAAMERLGGEVAGGGGREAESLDIARGQRLAKPSGPAFIYSGNGSQWMGMGKALLADPVFRQAVRDVDEQFLPLAGFSLVDELSGENEGDGEGQERYANTEIAQPALFAVQVGITAMLRHRGIGPVAVAGHSVGEVAAGWACGALSLAQAVQVIYHRSRLQGLTRGRGRMTAVGLGGAAARELLEELGLKPSVELAGINSARGVTVAGPEADLALLEAELERRDTFHKRLDLEYAFHSQAMDSVATELRESLAGLQPGAERVPFHSTVTGGVLPGAQLDAGYWWRNIRRPVLFESAVQEMVADGINIFLEIGPHPVLRSYVKETLDGAKAEGRVFAVAKRGHDEPQRVWNAASEAMIAGCQVHWEKLLPWRGRHVPLPTYAWQRQPCWHRTTSDSLGILNRQSVHPLLGHPIAQRELAWENALDLGRQAWLADHVVGEATVFPGTGYAELAIAAALAWSPGVRVEIEDLEILAPLLLDAEAGVRLRVELDGADGRLLVRSRALQSSEPWTVHASARALREPGDARLAPRLEEVPGREPDFTGAHHDELTRGAGLGYGRAFRAVEQGWFDDPLRPGAGVLAQFREPESMGLDVSGMHLHPAYLDCAFQLIIQMLVPGRDAAELAQGITYVPTRVGRVTWRSGGVPRYARAQLLSRAPHSVSARFALFDEEGRMLALIEGARFRALRLQAGAGSSLHRLHYVAVPAPHPACESAGGAGMDAGSLEQVLRRALSQPEIVREHARYAGETDPLLDSLCDSFAQEAAPGPERAAPGGEAGAAEIWRTLLRDHADHFPILHAVGRTGMHLTAAAHGEAAEGAMSRGSSLPLLQHCVLGPVATSAVCGAVRDAVAAALSRLPEGERLVVLESGAGAPAYGLEICGVLDFDRADYEFAGTRPGSLEAARHRLERYPAARITGVEAGTAPAAAGVHFALVALESEDAGEARLAIEAAAARLAPGGALLVIGQHPSRWMDFIFGAAPRPLQGEWIELLARRGLSCAPPIELAPGSHCGPWLVIAQRPAEAASPSGASQAARSWLVLSSDEEAAHDGLVRRLVARLEAIGDRVVCRPASEDAKVLAGSLRFARGAARVLDGVVLLPPASGREVADAEDVHAAQVARCAQAVALLRACEDTGAIGDCCLVTRGAQSHLLPARAPAGESLVESAAWGIGRTALNEVEAPAIRLIDLEPGPAADGQLEALARELRGPDAEQEVLLTLRGARFAPRLRLAGEPEAPRDPKPARTAGPVSLGFALPGQLRNLRWEARETPPIAPDEVEVAVHATGLNFRDVMYTLGLLSDEAVENGFAGASLGLEFAGIVVATGEAVQGYAPGDAVVGFGPSSFADRARTRVSAIAHIPEGLSFPAAATIPSTFFTAYYAMHHLARIEPGERILIHGAAGGVGIAAIQVAQWCGAEVFATAGSEEKRDFLRLLGVERIYDSRSLAYADEILADTGGEGVDVVLNSLAGEAINRNLRVLKPFGRFLELGKRDFYENTRIGLRPFRNNISYFGIDADQLMGTRRALAQSVFAEVMELFRTGDFYPLPYESFDAHDIVGAFRHMQQARQIGKIVVTYERGLPPAEPAPRATVLPDWRLRPDATYLVTGGLRGFGLRTASWLAERGARHLALLSRSGTAEGEEAAIVSVLQAQGVAVRSFACDVADRDQLAAVLARVGREMPVLRGVVHSAMVIDDALLRNVERAQIDRVFRPKVLGAMHLDALTRTRPLDFFLVHSSATTLFGNPGQASYIAANLALEAIVRRRRAARLPGTCVGWGVIEDAGFLSRNERMKQALLGRMGGGSLTAAQALAGFEEEIVAGRSDLAILPLDWRALSRFLPSAASPKFADLARALGDAGGEEEGDGAEDIERMLRTLPDNEILAALSAIIKREASEILRVPADRIDENRSLYDMGLDSLMGVELAVALESRLGVRLPVLALSENPTLARLAARFLGMLRGEESGREEEGGASTLAHVEQVASAHDVEVSPEELARIASEVHEDIRAPGAAQRMIR